jgi:spermidine/putrescine transport system ATP-binding protein
VAAVEVRDVTHHFRGQAALRAVTLSIEAGKFFSLLGPSGCGKTTTLNIIGGFVIPDQGDVLIQGRSMRRVPPYARPVNTVFQNYALFPHMTVAENIGFGPRMARVGDADAKRRVGEALDLVALSGMENRHPDQLSGGQQQRVALARALVNRPSVLLLDEPLGALDLKLRKQMQSELMRIQREVGVTFVYVTHDQEEAMAMSDCIAVMHRGTVAQVGSPKDVYEHPASLFVADFVGASNVLRGRMVEETGASATIRLDAGRVVRAPAPTRIGPERRVALVFRPEYATVAAAKSDRFDENVLTGRVLRVSYLGTHLQVEVEIAPGTLVNVRQSLEVAEQAGQVFGSGENVFVIWPSAKSLVFADDGDA